MAFGEQEMTRLWDSLGCPPLHYTYVVYDEIAELLIAKGADVDAKGCQWRTPLDYANGETADLLRKHGAKTAEEEVR